MTWLAVVSDWCDFQISVLNVLSFSCLSLKKTHASSGPRQMWLTFLVFSPRPGYLIVWWYLEIVPTKCSQKADCQNYVGTLHYFL